jgi:hypothetical protein
MNILIYIVSFLIAFFTSFSAYAETVKVITKENAIREECKFFSPVKAVVKYSDLMNVLSTEGDWIRVQFKDVKGCIHKSAVEEKKVSLSGVFSGSQTATKDEVALAGKGFNPQVENSFKKKHPELNYYSVDQIESYKTSDESLKRFMIDGGLKLP